MINTKEVKDLIVKGKLEEALESLLQKTQDNQNIYAELQNEIMLLSYKYNELKRREQLNLSAKQELSVERSQISHGLLQLLDRLQNPDKLLQPGQATSSNS